MQQPVWPSLEEQLVQANVVPGSALEQLIRNNQDFHLLRPEEVNDTIGLPLWLRVYWRKQHPEWIYAANDPTGGYPRVLKNVYAWMLTHQDLRPSPPPAPTEPTDGVAPSVPSAVVSRVAIGPNRRISGAQTTSCRESDIRVNYQNSDKIIAASNSEIGGWQRQFYSRDGGTTWGQTSLRPVLKDTQHTDPTVDWTSDGTAWAITLGIELQPVDRGKGGPKKLLFFLRAYRSSDGGATWAFDATLSGSRLTPDKEMMWVDHSPTSPFKDNIYVIWHDVLVSNSLAFVTRRTQGAWQTPLQISGPETTGLALGGEIKANSAGDVFAFWPDTGSHKLWVAKSINGGATFSSLTPIATTFASNTIKVPSFRAALIYLSSGAYRTATKNLVYATWVDLTGASGCTTSDNQPGDNVSSTCKARIWFSRSTDGGTMWEPARMINNQASLNDQFHPRLAVDEFNGRLVVVYYDTVSDPGRKKTDVWFQSSDDDGMTWSTPIKVTTAQTDETTGVGTEGVQYGDYIGLSGYAGVFSASWTDRRSGGWEEIWTADIFVPPPYPLRRFLRSKGIDPSKGLRSIRPPITSVRAFMGI